MFTVGIALGGVRAVRLVFVGEAYVGIQLGTVGVSLLEFVGSLRSRLVGIRWKGVGWDRDGNTESDVSDPLQNNLEQIA